MKKLIILFIMSMVSLCAYAQFRPNYNMPEYMIPAEYAIALNHTEEITINDFPKNYSGQIDLEVSYRGTYIKVYKLNVTETFNFEFFTTSSKSGFEFYFAGDNPKTILGYATAHAVFAYPDNQSLQQYGTVAVYAPIYLLLWGSARLPEEELPYYSIQFSKNNPSPTITWQQEETATGYRIDIYYENGEVITSLNFDASGNYVGIVQKSLS
ncbi:MAG: hypothetical protein LBU90_09525, partial [Bacteroidales bacterium]|nr:hypothetical protein [Bacteroidales bacterium]